MLTQLSDNAPRHFRSSDEVSPFIRKACEANPDVARYHIIGHSEEGRPIEAAVLGSGTRRVSLIAGSHSDEPVGPETLRTLIIEGLARREELRELFREYTFLVVPQVNPDGEARNRPWRDEWPSIPSYLRHAFRELPGRDVEFGYPGMRKENTHVSDFLIDHGPMAMHMSLHGMSFSEGALLLIERHWVDRTARLRQQFRKMIERFGLGPHDHDRGGEKGFKYVGPGFSTTPEGSAMRAYFNSQGDHETASLFNDSSMEFVRKIGGDPLCLVTEFPLFVIGNTAAPNPPGVPQAYLDLLQQLAALRRRVLDGKSVQDTIDGFRLRALPLKTAIELQLHTIQLGLEVI